MENWEIIDCGYIGNKESFDKTETDKYYFVIRNKDTKEIMKNVPYSVCEANCLKGPEGQLLFSLITAGYKIKKLYYQFQNNQKIDFSKRYFGKTVIKILYYNGCFDNNKSTRYSNAAIKDFLLKRLKGEEFLSHKGKEWGYTPNYSDKENKALEFYIYSIIKPYILSHYKYK